MQNGERVAVKFEKHSTRCPQLRHEYKVYRELQTSVGFGRVRDDIYRVVMYSRDSAVDAYHLCVVVHSLHVKFNERFSRPVPKDT